MSNLSKRQLDDTSASNHPETDAYDYNYNCYDTGDCNNWWYSDTGSAVRYTIVSVLFFLLFAYFVGGYWHARHRLRKNLTPLRYHRWMVRRSTGPRYYYPHGVPMYAHNPHGPQNQHQNPYYGQHQHPDSYGMQGSVHAPPPPAYHAGDAPPPVYQPPQGSSKVAADQGYAERERVGESSEMQAPGAAATRNS